MTDHQPQPQLEALQDWYSSHCDGDWEHEFGLRIENIDNPGWSVSIPVSETELAGRPFTPVQWRRADDEWVLCRVEDEVFRGSGGSRNLTDLIQIFLDWAGPSSTALAPDLNT